MGARTRVVRNSAVPNPGLPRGIFAPLLAAAGRILAKDAAVLFHDIGIGKADEASLSLSTAFRARPLRTSAFRQARTLPQATRTHRFTEGFTSSTDFEKVLGECLSGDIPSCFVEYFPALLEAGRSTLGAPPRVLLSANGWTFDETFKAAAALAAERGTRLVGVQHGGGYGLYARMWQEQLERSVTDAYWCWGWSELDGDRRLRDVPAPSLSFPADDRRPGSGLLFVANAQPRYPYGFQSQALAERCLEGIEDEISFFETLPGTVRGKSSVRITEQDETWGWSAAARIRSRFSDIGVQVARGPLHESLREAALTVIDHPATSLLEALALDRPTILYWRPEVWDARSHVVPLLDGLRRAGVLFDEPLAAARAAAKAWKNPRSWWGRSEVREAIGNFRASLALGAPDWRKRWAEALKDEAAQ
jgi:putative transferase (TIGR04331 family)